MLYLKAGPATIDFNIVYDNSYYFHTKFECAICNQIICPNVTG